MLLADIGEEHLALAEEFIPPAPEPIVRAPRMPTFDELPAVVQPVVRQARGEIVASSAPAQPERRRSLLEKLAAFGITKPEDMAPRAAAPLAPPRQLSQAPVAAPRAMPPRPLQGSLDAQGRTAPRPPSEEDQLEIPAFLRRSNGI